MEEREYKKRFIGENLEIKIDKIGLSSIKISLIINKKPFTQDFIYDLGNDDELGY